MSSLFPTHLSSERVLLRRLIPGDVAALCSYRSLPEVARYQGWESFTAEDAARLIASQAGAKPGVPGTWLQLAIVEVAAGTMIGDCGLHWQLDDVRQMELGITLAPRHQRKGYASEALGCVLDYLFGSLDVHRVSAFTDVENTGAAALFRRLEFRQEAHFIEHRWFKGRWQSEFLFAMLRAEWAGQNGGKA